MAPIGALKYCTAVIYSLVTYIIIVCLLDLSGPASHNFKLNMY